MSWVVMFVKAALQTVLHCIAAGQVLRREWQQGAAGKTQSISQSTFRTLPRR